MASEFLAELDAKAIPVVPMDLHQLGREIFSRHLAAFEIIGLVLLATMIGAVSIAKRKL